MEGPTTIQLTKKRLGERLKVGREVSQIPTQPSTRMLFPKGDLKQCELIL